MITLTILGILLTIGVIIFTVTIGGILVVFGDVFIAAFVIYLLVKLIRRHKNPEIERR